MPQRAANRRMIALLILGITPNESRITIKTNEGLLDLAQWVNGGRTVSYRLICYALYTMNWHCAHAGKWGTRIIGLNT